VSSPVIVAPVEGPTPAARMASMKSEMWSCMSPPVAG
jgi:hypothetical protein